ncbi:MAG TPA: hypothetical protein PLS81_02560 [Deltaproteobacteria bacterium]|nr:hypothetical protein [Deltaproteobacteria bacterium]HOM28323.1 hypothetical protein [Deltaproteobacteria bacterium]HPP79326.1 hypothetical protein [Deltaproteobacteria bacterium]
MAGDVNFKDTRAGRRTSDARCARAAQAIMEILKYQCQGFILPPPEVRHLLGLDPEDRAWHLNERVALLKKELARRFVAMDVSPIVGATIQLYRVPPVNGAPYPSRYLRQ